MRSVHTIALAVVAVLAFGAFATSSAFAEEVLPAEWLVSGKAVTAAEKWDIMESILPAVGILFEDMKEGIDVLCTEATGLSTLLGPKESEMVEGKCTKVESMTSGVTCTKMEPVKLPWLGVLLGESSDPIEDITSIAKTGVGWELECAVLGIKAVDVCTTESLKANIDTSTEEEMEAIFNEAVTTEEEAACTLSKEAKTGLKVGGIMLDALTSNGLELLSLAIS